jgi:hypothetical protein
MSREDSVTKRKNVNRAVLGEPFLKYIEYMYFADAINVLDDKIISFEFENFKSYCSN